MPRKYRPPASSKRRKAKQTNYDFPTPEETGGETAVAEDDLEDAPVESMAAIESRSQAKRSLDEQKPERHVRRDLAYVRNEAIRIGILGSVLIAAIVVAGFFR